MQTFQGLLAIDEFAALGLRDSLRDLFPKLLAVLFDESLPLTEKAQTLGKQFLERAIVAASKLVLHERAKVVRDALDGHGPSANSLCRFDCLIWAEKAQRSSFDSESETH